jgi:hypothetical protein
VQHKELYSSSHSRKVSAAQGRLRNSSENSSVPHTKVITLVDVQMFVRHLGHDYYTMEKDIWHCLESDILFPNLSLQFKCVSTLVPPSIIPSEFFCDME